MSEAEKIDHWQRILGPRPAIEPDDRFKVKLDDIIDSPLRQGMEDIRRRAVAAAMRGEVVRLVIDGETVGFIGPFGAR